MKSKRLMGRYARYVTTNVLGMLGLSCYILADTFFISQRLGSTGLAALNLAIPVYSLINGTGLMIGIGGATKYAMASAREDWEEGNRTFTAAAVWGLIAGLVFAAAGLLASAPLSRMLGAPDAAFSMTDTYLKTILGFAPLFLLNNVAIAFVRNDGAPHLAMAGMLLGSLSNIVLDYLFLFPLHMGMFGAALATGLAPGVSLFCLSFHKWRGKNGFRLRRCRPGIRGLGKILLPGLSAFVSEVSSGVILTAFNLVILRLTGTVGVAAYGVVANLALVATAMFTGVAQGIQPLASAACAGKDGLTLKRLRRWSGCLALVMGVLLYAAVFVWADGLTAVFNSSHDPELAGLAETGLRLYFVGFLPAGINIVLAAYFSAVQRPGLALTVSVTRGMAALLPLVILLAALLGMTGVWLAFPCAEAAALLVLITLGTLGRKKESCR